MGLREVTSKQHPIAERTETLPASGEQVRIVGMSRRQQRAWQKSLRKPDGTSDPQRTEMATELLAARCCVDELGKPELTDQEVLAGAFDNLDSRDWAFISDIVEELVFGRTARANKDALKNSPTLSSVSSGDSPETAE